MIQTNVAILSAYCVRACKIKHFTEREFSGIFPSAGGILRFQNGNSRWPWFCPSVKRVHCDNQRHSCRPFIGLTIHAKMIGAWGTSPSTWNFESNWPRWSEIVDFRSIFARSASAVTPSEKSSIITNSKSTTRFPMSVPYLSALEVCSRRGAIQIHVYLYLTFTFTQYEHRSLSISPQRVAQKRKVSKIWTISCDISETVRNRLSVTIDH